MKLRTKHWFRSLLRKPSMLEQSCASGAVLSMDPPIVIATFDYPDPTAQMRAFATRLPRSPSLMILVMSWIFEPGVAAAFAILELRRFRKAFPWIEIVLTCSEQSEVDTMASLGEAAHLISLNAYVSESCFYPLYDAEIAFDAIYNARFSPQKRVDLAQDIDGVAYITRQIENELQTPDGKSILDMIADRDPRHRILNLFDGADFKIMSANDVNRACNSACVGLCLSPKEGSMIASMEYMLAGLPIVSVPNVGGRDEFFDADYWIVATPDSNSVRDAVIELRGRKISRSHVRARTLAKLQPHRQRFLDIVNAQLERIGSDHRFSGPWPWLHLRNFFAWKSIEDHFADGRNEDLRRKAAALAGGTMPQKSLCIAEPQTMSPT